MSTTQQEVIKEINNKSNKSEKRYVRAITRGKKNKYLNVSIPPEISARLQLNENSFVKLYVDKLNNLCFTKLDI
jgi:hypothetical protein